MGDIFIGVGLVEVVFLVILVVLFLVENEEVGCVDKDGFGFVGDFCYGFRSEVGIGFGVLLLDMGCYIYRINCL